uniref:Growth factor receptor bound protein 7 n=1 Tax=Tetraodon nigroviridis TaxID=99883 RepID=H3D2S5_TETNG
PLMADSAGVRRSQPIFITSNSFFRVRRESFSSSVPSIPNPFPELCSPSKSPVLISSLPPQSSDKHLIKVYSEDSHSRSVWVSSAATAREVCHMLVQTAHCSDQENWALLEVHPTLGLERCLEDHEVVLEVQASWSIKSDTRFVFCKNYAKYEFFRKPMLFFPECMISDSAEAVKGTTPSTLIQNLLKSGACPEIQGFLHLKEPSRRSWKKVHFFLRRSGLYSSTKGSSKEPRHLQYVADLEGLNVYSVVNSRKLYGAPTDFTFCIKSSRSQVRSSDLKMMCAENEQTRRCWTSALRLFKHGKQLQCNYQLSNSAPLTPTRLEGKRLTESTSETSLVAMDFSGKAGGRVIQNLAEAQSAEQEEGQAWRAQRREALRCSLPNLSSGARPSSLHVSQPWFHGGVSRKEAQRLIEKQGLVDGMFLIRESQQHAQCFVLSLCHKLKIKHYLVIPCEDGGRKYFTIDDGLTLFIDLLQLVEFHQINKGILPVCLKHPCVCVVL